MFGGVWRGSCCASRGWKDLFVVHSSSASGHAEVELEAVGLLASATGACAKREVHILRVISLVATPRYRYSCWRARGHGAAFCWRVLQDALLPKLGLRCLGPPIVVAGLQLQGVPSGCKDTSQASFRARYAGLAQARTEAFRSFPPCACVLPDDALADPRALTRVHHYYIRVSFMSVRRCEYRRCATITFGSLVLGASLQQPAGPAV